MAYDMSSITLAARLSQGLGRRVAALGDSLTRYNDVNPNIYPSVTDTTAFESVGPLRWLNWISGQAFDLPPERNFGVSGQTTTEILARVGDVIACNPTLVFVLGGANDPAEGIDRQTTVLNLQSICRQLIAAGAYVVLIGAPPRQTWGTLSGDAVQVAQRGRFWINRTLQTWSESVGNESMLFIDIDEILSRNTAQFGTLSAGGTTSVTLPTGLVTDAGGTPGDNYFRWWRIALMNGTVIGQSRLITAYNGSTRVATLLGSGWPTTGAVSLTASASGNVITRNDGGSFVADGFEVGAGITLAGFNVSGNNGSGTITQIVNPQIIVVSRSLSADTAAGASVTVTTPTSSSTFMLQPISASRDVMTVDGLHWSPTSALRIARRLWSALQSMVRPRALSLTTIGSRFHPTDNPSGNLLVNGMFLGTGATVSAPFTGVCARGWAPARGATYSSTGTFALSKETDSDTGYEKQVLAISGVTGGASIEQYYLRQTLLPGPLSYGVGDAVELCAELDISNVASINQLQLVARWTHDAAGNRYIISDGRNQAFAGDGTLVNLLPTELNGKYLFKTPVGIVGDFSGASAPNMFIEVHVTLNAAAATPASITLKVAKAYLRKVGV